MSGRTPNPLVPRPTSTANNEEQPTPAPADRGTGECPTFFSFVVKVLTDTLPRPLCHPPAPPPPPTHSATRVLSCGCSGPPLYNARVCVRAAAEAVGVPQADARDQTERWAAQPHAEPLLVLFAAAAPHEAVQRAAPGLARAGAAERSIPEVARQRPDPQVPGAGGRSARRCGPLAPLRLPQGEGTREAEEYFFDFFGGGGGCVEEGHVGLVKTGSGTAVILGKIGVTVAEGDSRGLRFGWDPRGR